MNGGVATAKTYIYPNDSYDFPSWLKEKKVVKDKLDVRDLIIGKIGSVIHNSNNKNKDFLLRYFIHMFRNNTFFAVKMKNKFTLNESEIKYLLGASHQHKLKDILLSHEPIYEKLAQEELEEFNEKDKKENLQQSLFDF
jgi:hypothetical protein